MKRRKKEFWVNADASLYDIVAQLENATTKGDIETLAREILRYGVENFKQGQSDIQNQIKDVLGV